MSNPLQCLQPSGGGGGGNNEGDGVDGPMWFVDVGNHQDGKYSMALAQGNEVLEDQCRIECGLFGTFVAVCDGHGGHDAARFACLRLFQRFHERSFKSNNRVREETVRDAILDTEADYMNHVEQSWPGQHNIATNGTCCLVGVVHRQNLFLGNLGDCRAVLGRKKGIGKFGLSKQVSAIQLSTDHNCDSPRIRDEVKDLHPAEPNVVELCNGSYRIKRIIQVSRSLGDAYLKRVEYNREPILEKYRLQPPMYMPYVSAEPEMFTHRIQWDDAFVIFASDGLWNEISNERAVALVNRHPREGSARMLVETALTVAATRRGLTYQQLLAVERAARRQFHDDIAVIIMFFNRGITSSFSRSSTPLEHPESVSSPWNLISH